MTVGRLDIASEGLLLLTNDGGLARHLELPATGWTRRYRIRVRGRVEAPRLAALARGVTVDGIRYGPITAVLDVQKGANAWITMGLREGKNREVRRVLEHLGWPVNRLIRLSYGPFQLGNLKAGEVDEVRPRVLKDALGAEARRFLHIS
jgi:23S rRNA pseudouridine2605 synthase